METTEFLQRILPPGGVYCWATPAKPNDRGIRFEQRFTTSIERAAHDLTGNDAHQVNTYYAMASFKKRGTRAHDNVAMVKAFWLDIDCGAEKAASGKGYATKRDGVAALFESIKKLGLPLPMIVDSGNGLHIYWPLVQAVSSDRWRHVAEQLVAALQSTGLISDYQCAADQSRILRPVGTHNWKDPANPKEVLLKRDCPDVPFEQIAEAVKDFVVNVSVAKIVGGINSDLDLHYDDVPANADLIADECGQMAAMRDSKGNIYEPEWRNCLGVLKHCEDGEAVAIAWSSGHPHFNRIETLKKLAARKDPTRCDTFAKDNKNICNTCVHRGNITSPIQLGRQELPDAAPEAVVPEPVAEPVEAVQPLAADPVITREVVEAAVKPFEIPESMSATYKWAKNQLWAQKGDGMVAFSDVFIVADRMVSAGGKVSVSFRARMLDGRIKMFDIAGSVLTEKATCIKALGDQGIAAFLGRGQEMQTYMHRWFEELSRAGREAAQYQYFGWQPDGSFLVGNRVYLPGGLSHEVQIGAELNPYKSTLSTAGTCEGWTEIISQVYAGEGMEQFHFMLGVGFGAPLMELANTNGVMMSALSESGFGKTACERCMLAIWGNPNTLFRSFKGMTLNSVYDHISLMHSLPVVIDEISTAKPEEVSNMAYDVSAGQSKVRLDREGKARETRAQWHTIVQTSSNFSLWEKLAFNRVVSDAQWVRLLEFRMQKNFAVTQAEARTLLNRVSHNFGAVGAVYAQYIVDHRAEVTVMIEKLHAKIDELGNIKTTERFWSAGVACVIAGLVIAQRLGLIHCKPNDVMKWAITQIRAGRSGLATAAPTKVAQFKAMINDIGTNRTIVTPTISSAEDLDERTLANSGRNEIMARVVIDQDTMWVTKQFVRNWCGKQQANFRDLVEAAIKDGLILKEEEFSLGQGTVIPSASVRCFKIDLGKLQEPD
jgi:hypothetical protein